MDDTTLDAIEARQKAAASARWEIIGDRVGPRALMALLGEDVPALVAEVRGLTEEAATQREWFEAADAAAERRLDQSIAWMERAEAAEAEVVTLRARLAAVEALADQWADRKRSDGMSGNAWIGLTLSGVAADLRAALATTGEGEHVAREVFTADGIPFVRCSCTNAKSPTSHRWLSEHVPNGGVAELQAVVKRQAEGAKA